MAVSGRRQRAVGTVEHGLNLAFVRFNLLPRSDMPLILLKEREVIDTNSIMLVPLINLFLFLCLQEMIQFRY